MPIMFAFGCSKHKVVAIFRSNPFDDLWKSHREYLHPDRIWREELFFKSTTAGRVVETNVTGDSGQLGIKWANQNNVSTEQQE